MASRRHRRPLKQIADFLFSLSSVLSLQFWVFSLYGNWMCLRECLPLTFNFHFHLKNSSSAAICFLISFSNVCYLHYYAIIVCLARGMCVLNFSQMACQKFAMSSADHLTAATNPTTYHTPGSCSDHLAALTSSNWQSLTYFNDISWRISEQGSIFEN